MPLDYDKLFSRMPEGDLASAAVEFASTTLIHEWMAEYKLMTPHATNIVRVALETFTYVYDLYSELEAMGEVPYSKDIEDRLVAAFGTSKPPAYAREAGRLRGWIGPTEEFLGAGRDKGHFIAHSIGGHIDRFEINLFSQSRRANRGWSVGGKRYRRMEKYCAANPGTFCFTRPLYGDQTSKPSGLEFGILRPDRTLWAERFDN